MKQRCTFWSFMILLLAGAAAAAPAGAPGPSGAPFAEPVLASASMPGYVSSGPDDALPIAVPLAEGIDASFTPDAQVGELATPSGLTASVFLDRLAPERRPGASIQLELARDLEAATAGRSAAAEAAWADGRFNDAIDAVRALEADGFTVNVAVSFADPPVLDGPTVGSNVRVAATIEGETPIGSAVDVDRHSGNLLILGRSASDFAIFRSIDGGSTWAQTASWCCDPGKVDLSAVATWGYIVYDVPVDNEIRMRRVFGTTGAFDGAYFWKPVALHPGLTIAELVMETNADVYDNRIYAAAHLSDGTVAWWWSDALVGATFSRVDPGVANIGGGLAMSYVHGYDGTTPYLYLSYRSAAGNAWLFPRSTAGWGAGTIVESELWASSTTSVSAYGETVLVAYCKTVTDGTGSYYQISYDAGANWVGGTLVAPAEGGDFFQPMVSARSGSGTAMIAQDEAGTFDRMVFRQRFNYHSGAWSALQPLNDVDFMTGSVTSHMEYLYTGWGLTYLEETGPIWFTLSRALFYSGFERGDRLDWSLSVP